MRRGQTKLTPEIQEQFCTLISNSSHFVTACEALKLPERTVRNWIAMGRDEEDAEGNVTRKARDPWLTFRLEFEKAQATAELLLIEQVKSGGWKGAAWLLSRRYGERWREQKQVEMVGAGGSPLMPTATPAIILVTNGAEAPAPWIREEPDGAAA